jgi:4-hydroxy-tetrahydrodipicolinate reductase
MPLALSILGGTGKMGKCVLACALQDPELHIAAATSRTSSVKKALSLCDVAIDFSTRDATLNHLDAALFASRPLVIGTTGHLPEEIRFIEKAARKIPIVLSANFSLGIALALEMASLLGSTAFGQSTICIYETHHVHKKDKPSGTALALARAIGTQRAPEQMAIHSIREGETVGEHLLTCETAYERIEIKHTAHSREAFAQGALLAAKKLAGKSPGLYTLKDLLT